MKLTTTIVAGLALPEGKSDVIFWDDAIPGFGIRVRSSGRRLWVFQFRIGNQQRRMTLGVTTAVTAADARKAAEKLYAQTQLGQDPAATKIEHQARSAETFGAAVELYLGRQKSRLRSRSYEAVERHLIRTASSLHRLPLAKVDRRAIAALLARVATAASDATANRTRSSLSGLFAFAIQEGLLGDEGNPVTGTETREERSRDRLLTDDEVAAIWAALGEGDYADIVRLIVLTGARRAEIGSLKWDEVDLERGLVSLPAGRVKNGHSHSIALSTPAVAILKARLRDRETVFGTGKNGFNSWGDGRIKLDRSLREAGVQMPPFVLHDLRRYLSTTMHERLSVQPHIVEACLGHVGHKSGVAGIYNRSTYLAEKARAMAIWADHIGAVTGDSERRVVPIHA